MDWLIVGFGWVVVKILTGLKALYSVIFSAQVLPLLIMAGSVIGSAFLARWRLRQLYLEIQLSLENQGIESGGVAGAIASFGSYMSGSPLFGWACNAFAVDKLAVAIGILPVIFTGWLALRMTRFGIEMARDARGLL